MTHITDMDDTPPKPPPFSANLPGRDTVNMVQVNTLLNAINGYMVFLTNARETVDDPRKGGYSDGGAVLSAEQTLIAMNNRLQTMVADESRWSMKTQVDLEASLLSVHESQKEYLRYQRNAIVLRNTPHARIRPTIAKLADGRWAAIYGDPETAQSIIGLGNCAEEALEDFDRIFDGRHQQLYEQQKAMDGSGGSIPAGKPKLTELPGFGRRIKANRESSINPPLDAGSEKPEEPKRKPRTRRRK